MTYHEAILKEYYRRDGQRDMSNYATGMTDNEVVRLLADQKGNRARGNTEKRLRDRWVRSEKFVPMVLPTDMVWPVRIPSGKTKSFTTGPIVVEDNFRGVAQVDPEHGGRTDFVPPWLIIDGQHRHAAAQVAGQKTMHCLVGINAVPKIHTELLRRADTGELDTDVDRLRRIFIGRLERYTKTETGARAVLEYVEPAPPECLIAGTVCEYCRHFISKGTKCGLFQLLDIPAAVKPDAYCTAFV